MFKTNDPGWGATLLNTYFFHFPTWISAAQAQASAAETIDCTGLLVVPGVIDTQVHFREPGMEWKEDLQSGSLAAVMGGVTAVFEMPNTEPTTTSPDMHLDTTGARTI